MIPARQSPFGQFIDREGVQTKHNDKRKPVLSETEDDVDPKEDIELQVLDTIQTVEEVLAGVVSGTLSQTDTFRALLSGMTNMREVLSLVQMNAEC